MRARSEECGVRTRAHEEASTRRVGLGLNDGGWCPTCKGEAYFMAKWRGVMGNYASVCKQCGERRLFVDTDLIGAINALIADGGTVTRRAWTRGLADAALTAPRTRERGIVWVFRKSAECGVRRAECGGLNDAAPCRRAGG